MGQLLFECTRSAGEIRGFDFFSEDPYPREIFYCYGRGKEQSFDLQFDPWGGAYSRALKAEKL